MAQKTFSIILMLALPMVILGYGEDAAKTSGLSDAIQKQLADAIKLFEDKKETYRKDVLDLFERKEKDFRGKGDLKLLNLIKHEKNAFIENGKAPTFFYITEQKRYLELAKLDLIKSYEKAIKDCLKSNLDTKAEEYSSNLKELKAGKNKSQENAEIKKEKTMPIEALFSTEEAKAIKSSQEDAIKLYEDKKETYFKDVLALFERKEKDLRDKADLKMLNLIKKEKSAFVEEGKEPILVSISDQKRSLEIAKLDLIKVYEKNIKDCIKLMLDLEAEKFSSDLEDLKKIKIYNQTEIRSKKKNGVMLEVPFSAEEAKNAQKELAKSMGKLVEVNIDLSRGIKLDMVLIPAGKFMMGSPASEKNRRGDETQHEVTITRPFYIGKYEVTQEQWVAVMGSNPSETTGAKLPVTRVTWFTCQEFLRRLNNRTNGGYRLPTEAEWEYACRAGTTTAYSFGDIATRDNFNYFGPSTKPVGSYKPNAFGLYDMHGNVWEWCEDWYGPYPNGKVSDPLGATNGTHRILRGGRFGFAGWDSRSANRDNYGVTPNGGFPDSGFRLVKIK